MKHADIGGNVLLYILTIAQTNETFQIIELVVSILVSLVILGYRLWKWFKEAKKDGKITKEEIKDGIDTLVDGVEDIKDKIEKEKGKEEDKNV